jgi:internalin A
MNDLNIITEIENKYNFTIVIVENSIEYDRITKDNFGAFCLLDINKNIISFHINKIYLDDYNFLNKLRNLTTLDLGFNDLIDVGFLENLTSLISLNLKYNSLANINSLRKLYNLTYLNLQYNNLTDVGCLMNLKKLTNLNLKDNDLHNTDVELFAHFDNLNYLNLSFTKLDDYSYINQLKNLVTLELNNIGIGNFNFLAGLKKLDYLSLKDNSIEDIDFIKGLLDLKYLNLSRNCLININSLGSLKNLTSIDLSNNKINNINSLKELKKLRTLNLENNAINDIKALEKLLNLEILKLNNNNIKDVHHLRDLKKLMFLDLANNYIINISLLNDFNFLASLNLRNNKISDLNFLKKIKNLISLDISNCNINEINNIQELTNLSILNLRQNYISDIRPIIKLKELTSLDLDENQIKDVSMLKELKKLKSLSLYKNNIRDVSFLHELDNLTSISLNSNPINIPPQEIWQQGIKAIKNYFNEMERTTSEEYLYEAKMVMVGRGAVGKTALTKTLVNEYYMLNLHEPTTYGIDVIKNPFRLEIKTPDNTIYYKFNIWDFGGQEKYDATHQLFITERSIYLFLTDVRQEDNYLDFDYWLNTIKLLGGNSPVIVVITKIDERKKNYPQYQYKLQYKNIIDFVEVSCMGGYEETIEELKRKLKSSALLLPQTKDKLPKIWVDIRNILEEQAINKDFISYNDYLQICERFGLTKERADFLSQFLNDLGVIIHHQKDMLLKQTVIINTEWGIDGVYKVLDSAVVIEKNGFFTKGIAETIWNDEKYKDKQAELLQLMINYKLCFECKDGSGYVAPTLLKYDKPENLIWNDKDNVKLEYDYAFMPAGLVSRFIVETHEYIDSNYFWKYGVKLIYDNTKAIVEEDYIHKKIVVKVEGENKKGTLTYIRIIFEGIHSTYEKLDYKELISCNCEECKKSFEPTLFEFKELRQYEKEGEKYIKCKNGGIKNVEVRKLIDDTFEKEHYSDEFRRITINNVFGDAIIAEKIKNENKTISKLPSKELEEFILAINNIPENVLKAFKNEYEKELVEAVTDEEKLTVGEKIKNFMIKYGITVSEHMSAIYIVEYLKKIFTH